MGFLPGSTIAAPLWRYEKADSSEQDLVINLGVVQWLEANPERTLVSLFYAETSRATTQGPKELRGAVAQQFMSDVDSLFSPPA